MVLKVFLGNSKATLFTALSSFLRVAPEVAEEKNLTAILKFSTERSFQSFFKGIDI